MFDVSTEDYRKQTVFALLIANHLKLFASSMNPHRRIRGPDFHFFSLCTYAEDSDHIGVLPT